MTTAIAAGQKQDPATINNAANAGTASVQYESITEGSTTSTTYTSTLTGTTAAGGTFVAPPTGRVLILWQCGLFQTATGGAVAASAWCSIVVRAGSVVGSGTAVLNANDNYAVRQKFASTTNNDQQWGDSYMLTGLTAGASYNVQLAYKNADTAATIRMVRQRVTVVPAH